jgi:hypothetical protein
VAPPRGITWVRSTPSLTHVFLGGNRQLDELARAKCSAEALYPSFSSGITVLDSVAGSQV